MNVSMFVPYRSSHRSSDCDETFTSCCKRARGGFGNLENLKIVLAGVPSPHVLILTKFFILDLRNKTKINIYMISLYYLEYPVLPYISISMKFCTLDQTLSLSDTATRAGLS